MLSLKYLSVDGRKECNLAQYYGKALLPFFQGKFIIALSRLPSETMGDLNISKTADQAILLIRRTS